MSLSGDVIITIEDDGGANVSVAGSSVQVVMGTAKSGTNTEIVATKSLNTLSSVFEQGPVMQAAGLSVQRGGTVLCQKVATNTAGSIVGTERAAESVTDATNASPIVITTSNAHDYVTGAIVTVASVGGNTAANGTFRIIVLSSTTFSLVGTTGNGAYTSGGTVTFEGCVTTMTGTSVPNPSGTPYDDLLIRLLVTKGGTIGAEGILFTVSLDAGRNVGPNIPLGTASSYEIPGTGITIAFAAGTLVTGDAIRVATNAPTWNTAGLQDCLDALLASQYATVGWGAGIHFVGPCAGASATTLQTALEGFKTNFVYTRGIVSARDAILPTAWGGLGETESAWMSSILTDFSAVSAKRLLAGAGHYNMPSAFKNSVAGLPSYRRPLAWAQAARQVMIPPQRHSGRVRDGGLEMVTLDPINDPKDGFLYHDERVNPSLDQLTGGAGRFTSARTRVGLPGLFIVNPMTLAPPGSDFYIWPLAAVMDVACSIAHQVGQLYINSDVRLNEKDKTIFENDARGIEDEIRMAMLDQMQGMISAVTVTVNRSNNIATTKKIQITIKITSRGYVLEEEISIGYSNLAAAA